MRRHTSHGTICGTHQSTRFDRVHLLENPISKNCPMGSWSAQHWPQLGPLFKPCSKTPCHPRVRQERQRELVSVLSYVLFSYRPIGVCWDGLLYRLHLWDPCWYPYHWRCYQTPPLFVPVTSTGRDWVYTCHWRHQYRNCYSRHVRNISSSTVVFGNPIKCWLSIYIHVVDTLYCLYCWHHLTISWIDCEASGEEVAWNQGVDIYSIRRNTLLFAAIGVGMNSNAVPSHLSVLWYPTLFD